MRCRFCYGLHPKPVEDELTLKTTLCDEDTSHMPGNVSRNNVRIWRRNNPHVVIEGGKIDNPKFNYFRKHCDCCGVPIRFLKKRALMTCN
jgi:hypothetical protein